MLQTSLDKNFHLLALEYLATMVALADFNPALVVDCFNVLIGCVKAANGETVITRGLERLAIVSSAGFLRTFAHLSVMDPTSSVLEDIRQGYVRTVPHEIAFNNLPFSRTFGTTHCLFYRHQRY